MIPAKKVINVLFLAVIGPAPAFAGMPVLDDFGNSFLMVFFAYVSLFIGAQLISFLLSRFRSAKNDSGKDEPNLESTMRVE